jgi:hypothetical protein
MAPPPPPARGGPGYYDPAAHTSKGQAPTSSNLYEASNISLRAVEKAPPASTASVSNENYGSIISDSIWDS